MANIYLLFLVVVVGGVFQNGNAIVLDDSFQMLQFGNNFHHVEVVLWCNTGIARHVGKYILRVRPRGGRGLEFQRQILLHVQHIEDGA